jgi:hypothetical protein
MTANLAPTPAQPVSTPAPADVYVSEIGTLHRNTAGCVLSADALPDGWAGPLALADAQRLAGERAGAGPVPLAGGM